MPLVIICGVPCSGKTKRANEIVDILTKRGKKYEIINDDLCGIKYEDYGDFGKEKEARGKLRSELNKFISKDVFTIIDSANYIKGFRYELWCIARAASTPCCTVVPIGSYDDCRERNKTLNRLNSVQFEEMIQRWEEPDKNRKWESPLFPILDEETIEEETFIKALEGVAPSTLSRSTSNPPLKSTDFLQEVDLKVKEIMKKVQSRQKEMGGDCGVVINECGVEVALSNPLSNQQLSRTRQQFMKYLKTIPTAKDSNDAIKIFLRFLKEAAE